MISHTERLANKLQLELASRTPDGKFRTGDRVFITGPSSCIYASGTVGEVDDSGRTMSVKTPIGDVTVSYYSVLHDMTGSLSKDTLSLIGTGSEY